LDGRLPHFVFNPEVPPYAYIPGLSF